MVKTTKFHKREWERQRRLLSADRMGAAPTEAGGDRPVPAIPASSVRVATRVPVEFGPHPDHTYTALDLEPPQRARRRKPAPAKAGSGIEVAPNDAAEVTILLRHAQRPKAGAKPTAAEKRDRAKDVAELLSRFRKGDPDRRILLFLQLEALRIVVAKDPFATLRSFLGMSGRGPKEKTEERNLDIAIAVEERIAASLDPKGKVPRGTVQRAIAEVAASTKPKLAEARVHDIYYDNQEAARAAVAWRVLSRIRSDIPG